VQEEEDRRRQDTEAGVRRDRETRDRVEREAAESRKREEELRRAHEASFKRQSEDEARRRLSGGEPVQSPSIPRVAPAVPSVTGGLARPTAVPGAAALGAAVPGAAARGAEGEEARRVIRRPALALPVQKVVVPTPRPTRTGEQRNRGRLTVTSATSGEDERTRSVASFRRRTQRLRGHGADDQKEKIAREIILPEAITIQELASRMSERAVDVIKLLMRQGRMVTLTDTLDAAIRSSVSPNPTLRKACSIVPTRKARPFRVRLL
jgi:translation initiation factor IF-2